MNLSEALWNGAQLRRFPWPGAPADAESRERPMECGGTTPLWLRGRWHSSIRSPFPQRERSAHRQAHSWAIRRRSPQHHQPGVKAVSCHRTPYAARGSRRPVSTPRHSRPPLTAARSHSLQPGRTAPQNHDASIALILQLCPGYLRPPSNLPPIFPSCSPAPVAVLLARAASPASPAIPCGIRLSRSSQRLARIPR